MAEPGTLRMTTGDVAAASAILIAAATALVTRGEALWPPETLTPERLLRHYPAASWRVAWQGERAVACMSLLDRDLPFWPDDPASVALYLHKLAVHPQAQGLGLSSWMVQYAEAEARRAGVQALKLDTGTDRPKLRALYERCGFRPVGQKTVFGFNVTLYVLDLR